jgi:hypothetical protein
MERDFDQAPAVQEETKRTGGCRGELISRLSGIRFYPGRTIHCAVFMVMPRWATRPARCLADMIMAGMHHPVAADHHKSRKRHPCSDAAPTASGHHSLCHAPERYFRHDTKGLEFLVTHLSVAEKDIQAVRSARVRIQSAVPFRRKVKRKQKEGLVRFSPRRGAISRLLWRACAS